MNLGAILLAAIVLLIGGFAAGYDYEHSRADAAMKDHIAADRATEAKAQLDARKHELEMTLAANEAAKSYEEGKRNAQTESEKTVSDLLTGSLRLQSRWTGCEAARLSDSATAAGKLNAAARDRAESTGRIIAAAAACDAKDRAWQQWATTTASILTKASTPK